MLREQPQRLVGEREIARPAAVCPAPTPVDPADELAFLWMECAFLGAPNVGEGIWRAYARAVDDPASDALLSLYRSHRACLRAKLSLWHLRDHNVREPQRWRLRARKYLDLAHDAAIHLANGHGRG